MKNLPCYITLATIISLVLLTIVASLGVPLQFFDIASHIIGYATAAGVAAVYLTDGAPRTSHHTADAVEVNTAKEPAVVRPARRAAWDNRPAVDSLSDGALATLNLVNDPATVSIM